MAIKNLSVTQAKIVFDALVDEAGNRFKRFIITNDGHPKAVILSYEEYEYFLETLEMFSEDNAAVLG